LDKLDPKNLKTKTDTIQKKIQLLTQKVVEFKLKECQSLMVVGWETDPVKCEKMIVLGRKLKLKESWIKEGDPLKVKVTDFFSNVARIVEKCLKREVKF
jgi:hypothetical protein